MLVTTRVHVQRKRKLGFFDVWLLGSFAAYHAYPSVLGNPNETTNLNIAKGTTDPRVEFILPK